ncbi:MAG: isocitrate/isopropylmalate family dehydrogenase [Desulfomicrobium escambiense]|nr:isocitrate/isopropylmalate family dehydrogenase [Desulfomicrobium escambiense]
MWLLKNPHDYDVLVGREPVRRHHLATCAAQLVGGLGFACQRQHRRQATRSSSRRTARRPSTPGMYKVNPIATILAAKMMLDWLGETDKGERARRPPSPRSSQEGQVADLRHGRQVRRASTSAGPSPPSSRSGRMAGPAHPRGRHDDAQRLRGPARGRDAPRRGRRRVGRDPLGPPAPVRSTSCSAPTAATSRTSTLSPWPPGPARSPASASGSARSNPWPSPRPGPVAPVSTLTGPGREARRRPGGSHLPPPRRQEGGDLRRPVRGRCRRPGRDRPPGRLRPGRLLRRAPGRAGHRLHRRAASAPTRTMLLARVGDSARFPRPIAPSSPPRSPASVPRLIRDGRGVDAAALEPIYFRRSQAEEK